MKPFFILAGVLTGMASAHAQWTVYDPAVHTQQLISTAQEVAKFVEMIGNQVRQLRTLEQEVSTLQGYVSLFGNPASVRPASAPELRQFLELPEVGQQLSDLLEAADPRAAMTDNGNGVFQAIGTKFLTPGGTEVPRAGELYRPTAAIQATTQNFLAVSSDAASRRATLKAEIARTMTALSEARTDAEVQKVSAVLGGLGSALQSTDLEVAQATASVLVQDAATRADERRQSEARHEQQAAEFTEALSNYRRTFRLLTTPTAFPTP